MNPDHFESELKRRPMRQIPPAWRREILQSASAPEGTGERSEKPHQPRVPALLGDWLDWLWPRPVAWVGLATVWVLLVGLNISVHRSEAMLAPKGSSGDRAPQGAFAERQMILEEMLSIPAVPSEPGLAPKGATPRTERRSLTFMV